MEHRVLLQEFLHPPQASWATARLYTYRVHPHGWPVCVYMVLNLLIYRIYKPLLKHKPEKPTSRCKGRHNTMPHLAKCYIILRKKMERSFEPQSLCNSSLKYIVSSHGFHVLNLSTCKEWVLCWNVCTPPKISKALARNFLTFLSTSCQPSFAASSSRLFQIFSNSIIQIHLQWKICHATLLKLVDHLCPAYLIPNCVSNSST